MDIQVVGSQSLIRESVLPFSSSSFNGSSVLLQGVELGTLQVPLHVVELTSDLVSGPVVVGLRASLPVKGIDLVLGNDLASGKVDINPCVSDVPHSSVCDPVDAIPGLFPACAVTCAMARRVLEQASDGKNPPVNEVTVPLTEVPVSTPPPVSLEVNREPEKQRDELEDTTNSVLSAQMLVRK